MGLHFWRARGVQSPRQGGEGGETDARSQIQISESARAGYVCGLSFFCMGSFSF